MIVSVRERELFKLISTYDTVIHTHHGGNLGGWSVWCPSGIPLSPKEVCSMMVDSFFLIARSSLSLESTIERDTSAYRTYRIIPCHRELT